MRILAVFCLFFWCTSVWADIPATPVMTLYRFNGPSEIPYYRVEEIGGNGPGAPAGTLAQGTSVIPCLVMKNGEALTDRQGVPYVGFEVVVDARTATPAATGQYRQTFTARQTLRVKNHQCEPDVRYVTLPDKRVVANRLCRLARGASLIELCVLSTIRLSAGGSISNLLIGVAAWTGPGTASSASIRIGCLRLLCSRPGIWTTPCAPPSLRGILSGDATRMGPASET
jgi:hypothetical protein